MPLCEVCKEKPALIFFSSFEGGQKVDHRLCVGCAFDRKIQKAASYVEHVSEVIANDPVFKATVPDPEEAPVNRAADSQPAAKPQSDPQPEPETCAFCGRREAVVADKDGICRLCKDCCFLLYPQLDVQAAKDAGLTLEEALQGRKPPHPCKICGVREAQFFRSDGDFCIICARREKMPEADKTAQRMGLSEESFAAFAAEADAENPPAQTAAGNADAKPAQRFAVADRETVNGQELLVLRDNFTGMHYLTNGQLSAFTPLLDGSGKPFIMIG